MSRKQVNPPRFQASEFIDLQKSRRLVPVLAVTSLATLACSRIDGLEIVLTLFLLAQLAAMVCFCTLLIHVKDGWLHWQYGPGWIRGQVPLNEIEATYVVGVAHGDVQRWPWSSRGRTALEIRSRETGWVLPTPRAFELQSFLNARQIPRNRKP